MKPITITEGSARVKIYESPVKVGRKKYPAFLVRYYFDGKTVQKKFANLTKAREHATTAAERINNGSIQVLLMTEADRLEYSEAKTKLNGVPLMRAVEFYLSRHPDSITAKTTQEIYDELLVAKKQDGLSEVWLRDLRIRLLRFVERFPGPAAELSGIEIDAWLRSFDVGAKARNNFRISISAFVSFAKSRRYLPRDFSEIESIQIARDAGGKIEIYTPDEMQKLLNAARPAELPFLALGAFAGVRTAEISRLTWRDIGEEFLTVASDKAKTRSRRVVPALDALKWYLNIARAEKRAIWHHSTLGMHSDVIRRLAKDSGVTWKRNALRHSFISYRLAAIQNTAQVALECGTSERKIFTNYRELVTAADAERWFNFYKPVTKTA